MSKKKKNPKIEEFQQEVRDSAHKIWLAGLGALSTAEEEGSKLFKNLVDKGQSWESRGRETITDVKGDVEDAVDRARGRAENVWDRVEERLDDAVGGTLKRMGVPSRDEIATLTRRVEELTRVVEGMKDEPAKKPAAKKPAAKKTAAKSATAKSTATKTARKRTTTAKSKSESAS